MNKLENGLSGLEVKGRLIGDMNQKTGVTCVKYIIIH